MKNSLQSKKDYPAGTFVPLWELAPELAEKETRKVCLLQDTFSLPKGIYFLMESYCSDKDCDCRKVMINVVFAETSKILGTIGFGWESEKFYTKWMGDEELGRQMAGVYEEVGNIKNILSDYGGKCLKLVKNSLNDPYYVNLIKRHYKSFKESIA